MNKWQQDNIHFCKQLNLRIACFIQGYNTPSSRFRVLQYLPLLKKNNITCTIFTPHFCGKGGWVPIFVKGPFHRLFKRLSQLFCYFPLRLIQILMTDLSGFDVVLIQKSLMSWPDSRILERLIKLKNNSIIFDIDDAEFSNISNTNDLSERYITQISSISQVVITGNKFLANYFQHRCKTVVLPTTVNSNNFYPKTYKNKNSAPCIGWTGTSSNFRYLFDLIPVFEKLAATLEVQFCIISNMEHILELSHIPKIKFLKWNSFNEVEQLQNIDIGVMPLHNNKWTRGKCAFKLIQYQAIGIPSVVSPVGANIEIQQDGITGYFADTKEEWFEKIAQLANNRELREILGEQSRKFFLTTLSIENNTSELIRLSVDIFKKNHSSFGVD